MINGIYGIYDSASQCFVQFMPSMNDKIAEMTLTKLFKEHRLSVGLINDYPESFSVYKLGTFDDNTGIFTNLEQHQLLFNFSSVSSTLSTSNEA